MPRACRRQRWDYLPHGTGPDDDSGLARRNGCRRASGWLEHVGSSDWSSPHRDRFRIAGSHLRAAAMCTGGPGDPPFCLTPCPVCGNGVTEFPETCDDTTGTPESCDGCSVFCQLEDCDDGNPCTIDSCDPVTGASTCPDPTASPVTMARSVTARNLPRRPLHPRPVTRL